MDVDNIKLLSDRLVEKLISGAEAEIERRDILIDAQQNVTISIAKELGFVITEEQQAMGRKKGERKVFIRVGLIEYLKRLKAYYRGEKFDDDQGSGQ